MYRHTFTLTTRFLTDTERGSVSVDVEADFPLKEYIKHPRLQWLGMGHCSSVEGARECVDTAARTIHFMDGAGVRPSKAWVSLFGDHAYGMRCGVGPSGFDHTQVWNWAGGLRLVTTEPYGRGLDEALNWCRQHRWEARPLPEWGMWNPPATTLLLCAPPKRGADLDVVLWRLRTQRPIPLDKRQTEGVVTRQSRFSRGRGAGGEA